MNVAALSGHLPAAEVPPERLANNAALTEEQKLAEASRQFEAILLRQILESSQKTVIPSKFSDSSTASSIYRDMATSQLADSISKSGAFGLAQTFEHQLARQANPRSEAGTRAHSSAPPTTRSGAQPGRPPLVVHPHQT